MARKLTKLTPITRGDTPLFVVPVSVNGVAPDISEYTAYLTLTTNSNPITNADAFLHKTMVTATDDIDPVSAVYGPCFYYQYTNTDTENIDPTATYYCDVQINKSPTDTNNFTILRGTFQPDADYGRGLS